jgi:hypothetical protein
MILFKQQGSKLFFLVTVLFLFLFPSKALAGSCSGGWTCGTTQTRCVPEGCLQYECDKKIGGCHNESYCDDYSVPMSCTGSNASACLSSPRCGVGYCSGPNGANCTWYYWGCSGTSCVLIAGSGSDSCSSSCSSQGWGSWSACSNSCGNGSQSRTCNCQGDCCTGCSDSEGSGSCGATQTRSCCVCQDSCNCDASTPNYQNQCHAPYCGQYVCDTTYGQKCRGSSCAVDCQKTNCGNCADYRSTSLTIEASKVHDLPVSLSGYARDNNGVTDGVEDVHIYYDCPSGNCSPSNFWTSFSANSISINPADGSFSGNIKTPAMADLYNKTGGRDGESHNNHTLYFFAVQTEGGTCGNWLFATKTINLTNAYPQNQSLKLCQTNPENCFCGTGLDSCQNKPILSYTTNNTLRLKAVFYDQDQFPTQPGGYIRERDVDEAYIIFDDDNNESNGYFYRVKYKDDVGSNNYTLTEDGGTKASLISIASHSRTVNGAYNLNLTVDLDFTQYPKNQPFNTNIYLRVKDFAGKEIKTQMVSTAFTAAPYWYKLKNVSLNKKGTLENYLHNSPSPYDSIDDTAEKLLIIGSGGPVLVESNSNNSLGYTPIENYVSSNRWLTQGYSLPTTPTFFVNQYLSYAKSRKLVKYITSVSDSEIESNKINIYKGSDVTLTNDLNKDNFVVILRNADDTSFVNLRIDKNTFNQSKRSQAFLAQSITFSNNTTEANGLFIAFSFNLKDPPLSNYIPTPLKITGNLVSLEEIVDTTVRRRDDITKPSIFIVFSPQMYLDLLPYLSISKYDWQQLQ